MASEQERTDYVVRNWPRAVAAGQTYDISPLVILAQGAFESGWGTSFQARMNNNFHGLTVGSKTAFSMGPHWDGTEYKSSTGLRFRKYKRPEDGFLDFARFIRKFSSYEKVRPFVHDINAYADAISKSKYITEENGDDRAAYKAGMLKAAQFIADVVKKKSLTTPDPEAPEA